MWQEPEEIKSFAERSDMIDLSFSVECRELPYDHAYELSSQILELIPEISKDKRNAIQTLHGPMSGNGWVRPDTENIFLSKRSKLYMRINKSQLDYVKSLEGKEVNLFGNKLSIGKSSVKSFLIVKDLFCRFVFSDESTAEEDFLKTVQEELKQHGISIRKALCGKSKKINFDGKALYTRSLMIADLSKEDSLKIQENGVGLHRLYGCGIFLPHKSIDAVSNFKEDD